MRRHHAHYDVIVMFLSFLKAEAAEILPRVRKVQIYPACQYMPPENIGTESIASQRASNADI